MKRLLKLSLFLLISVVFASCIFYPQKKEERYLYIESPENFQCLQGLLISEDGEIVVQFSIGKISLSSLSPGRYQIVAIMRSNDNLPETEGEFFDHFVDLSLSIDETDIENGKEIILDQFNTLKLSFTGDLPENRTLSQSTGVYLFNRTLALLFGPFKASDTIYGLSSGVTEDYCLTVQDPENKTQFSMRLPADDFGDVEIKLDEIEYGEVYPIFADGSSLNPTEFVFTPFAHERPLQTLGSSNAFLLSKGEENCLFLSSNTEYYWNIRFEDNHIDYHLMNTSPADILYGCYITIGDRLEISDIIRSSYSVSDTIEFKIRNLLSDSENNLLLLEGEAEYGIEILMDDHPVFQNTYNVDDEFSFKGEEAGPYQLKISVNTGKWQDKMVKVTDFELYAESHRGAFKIANSTGIGGWEKVPDGFYYISYDTMINGDIECFVFAPSKSVKRNSVHAVIDLEHQKRDEITLEIGIGSPGDSRKKLTFFDTYNKGGPYPFPDETIVLDISDLFVSDIPLDQTCYIQIYDSTKTHTTGSLSGFSIEYDEPIADQKILSATDTPIETVDGGYITSQLNITQLWEAPQRDAGLPGNLPERIDHSESIWFPPIGNQGNTNACVTFSVAYYIGSFYNARNKGYDLSTAEWISPENTSGYPDKAHQDQILSPAFVYNQINRGEDKGSEFTDAIKVITQIGASTWEKMPFSTDTYTQYPDEAAWRDAGRNRGEYFSSENQWLYMRCHSISDIDYLKQLLNAGYLISINVDSSQLANLSINDYWYTWNYFPHKNNHASTIVGYDDTLK
ncbi:MAG TPA: hypothetical protein PK466_03665 [Thermotogota bacterium]|nr:hypothetical protein [Thermotogota bacterium]